MSAIGPGDWVECCQTFPELPLSKGGLYCVEAVKFVGKDCGLGHACDQTGLRLVGVSVRYRRTLPDLFCSGLFRPIYRPKSDLIESLKQPAPDAVRELITAD